MTTISIYKACRLTGLSYPTLWHYIKHGLILAHQDEPKQRYQIPAEEIDRLMDMLKTTKHPRRKLGDKPKRLAEARAVL